MDQATLAGMIDHTLLKPEANRAQIDKVIDEAIEHSFASVCVNGRWVEHVASRLAIAGGNVKTCAVAGFPLGAMDSTAKAIEATIAAKAGAMEIDFVADLPLVMAEARTMLVEQFSRLVEDVRAVNRQIIVKVIIESALLLADADDAAGESRIACVCQAARESGIDFVKTSTGFHAAGGASIKAVELMRRHAGPMKIKASGGIRNCDDALAMIQAGADRIGASSSVAIVKGLAGAGTSDDASGDSPY